MHAREIRLLRHASRVEDLLAEGPPEIVLAGRSNVGKSSLMNALTGRRGLARAGRRPGTTQGVLWFSLDDQLLLVDLPGYGFARAPEAVRSTWGGLVEAFFSERSVIHLVWILVDGRHPPSELDARMVQWMRNLRLPFQVVLTKGDRLSGNERPRAVTACAAELGLSDADAAPLLTSARDRTGIPEMWRIIGSHLGEDRVQAAGRPPAAPRPIRRRRAGEGGR
jgi:GTP-binding protein